VKRVFVLRHSKLVFLIAVVVVGLVLPASVHGAVVLTITPGQTIPQGTVASYAIHLVSSSPAATSYTFSLSGVPSGAYQFSPNPVTTNPATGTADVTLTVDASNVPIPYCPGSYSFTVTATSTLDSASIGSSLAVSLVGPPLQAAVSTDKATYKIGDTVMISLAVNRPSEGQLSINPPTGSPIYIPFVTYGPTYAVTKTLTADTIGRWTVNYQADDFCAGSSSGAVYFDVSPNTYDTTISLNGVPSDVSVNVNVDGQTQGAMTGSEIKKLTFTIDTQHVVSVDQYVSGTAGVRYYCAQNTWNVGSSGSRSFDYETQYQFTVATSPDGVTQVTGGGWFTQGSTTQTSTAANTLNGPPGTQYVFEGWQVDGANQSGNPISVTMDKPHTAIAAYQTQYQLIVDSAYGNPQGSGYYAAGSTATFSVTSPEGYVIQQVFTGWTGDFTGNSATGSINMDKPHTVHANWMTSYFQLYIIGGVIAAVVIVAALLFWRRSHAAPPPTMKPTPPASGEFEAPPSPPAEPPEGAMTCSSCGTSVPAGQTFCHNCGAKMS
jgi:hypothetical protein